MKVVKCAGGHFFDADTYKECPVCGAEMLVEDAVSPSRPMDKPVPQKKGKGIFDKWKKTQPEVPVPNGEKQDVKVASGVINNDVINQNDSLVEKKTNDLTVPLWEVSQEKDNQLEQVQSMQQTPPVQNKEQPLHAQQDVIQQANSNDNYHAETISSESDISQDVPTNSLQAEIQKISASDDGRTLSYFSAVMDEAGSKRTEPTDPVVGWLVCVAGKHFGESFNIHAGMNPIGRNFSNAIVLDKDNTVSREKHAVLIYEPKKREFYVKPGESSGLAYVNGDYITETIKITRMNTLELGNSKFVFMPLCGEEFGWEEYITKE